MSEREPSQATEIVVDQSVAENGEKTPKKRRSRKSEPVPAKLESAEMVSEGGPVGDELERQLGLTDVAQDYPLIVESIQEPVHESAVAEAAAEPAQSPVIDIVEPPQPGPGNPSPDAGTFAFLHPDASGPVRLWLYSLDGSGGWSIDLPFSPLVDEAGPQWSPDGKWIALVGRAADGVSSSIWLVPVDGGTCVLLIDHAASDSQPRWSPDGTLVAFVSDRFGGSSICVATPDGFGPVIQLTNGFSGLDDRNPCWDPNSLRIAFTRRTIDGDAQGDHIWTVSMLTGEEKQATKKLANRRQMQWCPGKAQIAFVTDESEWINIGVVNPDNSAGWNLASEAGDKSDPQYSPDGNRIMYTRRLRGEVRVVERPTSGATADPFDPGEGVASAQRWLLEKRVIYRFAGATAAPGFIIQDAVKDAERFFLSSPSEWSNQRTFVLPEHFEFETTAGLKSGALTYKMEAGPRPAVILLGNAPHEAVDRRFRAVEQALASAGYSVFVPTLAGSPGYGKKVTNAMLDGWSPESEIADLVDIIDWVRRQEQAIGTTVALVGWGYGGALALVAAGARPGVVDAVAAVDPVTDWDDELDQAGPAWRAWHLRNHGLPSAQRGRHGMRTPATFAGVIASPLLLIGTGGATLGSSAQLERLVFLLDEIGLPYERETTDRESDWATANRVAAFLDRQFAERLAAPISPSPSDEAPAEGEAMRTDEI